MEGNGVNIQENREEMEGNGVKKCFGNRLRGRIYRIHGPRVRLRLCRLVAP